MVIRALLILLAMLFRSLAVRALVNQEEPHENCKDSQLLKRFSGDSQRGDVCIFKDGNEDKKWSCPATCSVLSNNDRLRCALSVPIGWESLAPLPCRVPLAGADPWVMPWNRGVTTAPVELFPTTNPGPKPEVVHIVASSTLKSNPLLRCWTVWINQMITADPTGCYELHVIGGARHGDINKGVEEHDEHWKVSTKDKIFHVQSLLHSKDEKTGQYTIGPRDALVFTDLDTIPLGFYSRLSMTHDIMFSRPPSHSGPSSLPSQGHIFTHSRNSSTHTWHNRTHGGKMRVNPGFYMLRNTARTRMFMANWTSLVHDLGLLDGSAVQRLTSETEKWDLNVFDKVDSYSGRCAATFDLPRNSTGDDFDVMVQAQCAAVHAINSGPGGAEMKLNVLQEAYSNYIGVPAHKDKDMCVEVTYGDVATL